MNFKGRQLIIFNGQTPIGGCLDCSVSMEAEMIPVAGDDAEWEEYDCGLISWGMQSNHLIDAGNAEMMMQVGNTLRIQIGEKKDGAFDENGFCYFGDAIVSQAQIDAKIKSLCKGSFSFTGTGRLGASERWDGEGFLFDSENFALLDSENYLLDTI